MNELPTWTEIAYAVIGALITILGQVAIWLKNKSQPAAPDKPVKPDAAPAVPDDVKAGLPFGGLFLGLALALLSRLLKAKAGVEELDAEELEALKAALPLIKDLTEDKVE